MNNHDFTSTGLSEVVFSTANDLGTFFHDLIYLRQRRDRERDHQSEERDDTNLINTIGLSS